MKNKTCILIKRETQEMGDSIIIKEEDLVDFGDSKMVFHVNSGDNLDGHGLFLPSGNKAGDPYNGDSYKYDYIVVKDSAGFPILLRLKKGTLK